MNLTDYPPLHATTAQAAEAFDRDPLAGTSPKLKALWVGLSTTGGCHSAAKACVFARLTGITDAPDAWLTSGLVTLKRMGLVGRVAAPRNTPGTASTDGHLRHPHWVYFAKNGPAILDSSRAFRTPLPEKGFIVQKGDLFSLYLPHPDNSDRWVRGPMDRFTALDISKEDAWAAWNDKTHTVFSPRF